MSPTQATSIALLVWMAGYLLIGWAAADKTGRRFRLLGKILLVLGKVVLLAILAGLIALLGAGALGFLG